MIKRGGNSNPYPVGEWFVHRDYGVGQVKEIESKTIAGRQNTYARIEMPDSTVWIPADQLDCEQLRPLADPERFQRAVDVLTNPPKELAAGFTQRKAQISEALTGNAPAETARIIRDLTARRRARGGLNQAERSALKDLTRRFVQEWAACFGLDVDQASSRLNATLAAGEANPA
jgi:RNA polymerase-interacting CarD/CdnL/TRCF family regulator